MAVHAFTGGIIPNVLLIATGIIFIAGLWFLIARWGHGSSGRFISSWASEAFRDGGMAFLRILILDVSYIPQVGVTK